MQFEHLVNLLFVKNIHHAGACYFGRDYTVNRATPGAAIGGRLAIPLHVFLCHGAIALKRFATSPARGQEFDRREE